MHTLPDNIKASAHDCLGFNCVQLLINCVQLGSVWVQFHFIFFIYLAHTFSYLNLDFGLQVYITCLTKLYNKFIQTSSQFYFLNYTKIPVYDHNSSNVFAIGTG